MVARWELSVRLRDRRKELGIPVAAVTDELNLSRTRWSQIENDHTMIAVEKIPPLAELFKFDMDDIAELLDLREAASRRDQAWWLDHQDIVERDLVRFYGLEHGANSIRSYGAVVINGLLQTEEYARLLIEYNPETSRFDRNRLVAIRMKRQERLRDPFPMKLHVVMSEAALKFEFGRPAIVSRQLDHLVEMIHQHPDTISVNVLPFSAHPGGVTGASTFILLEFSTPHLPRSIWEEGARAIGLSEDKELAEFMDMSFEDALERSLDRTASVDIIEQNARLLEGKL